MASQSFLDYPHEENGGEPEVWHLSSEEATFQALVYGRRLNKDRLESLVTNVVRRAIDELQRQLEQATRDDEVDEEARLEAALRDLPSVRGEAEDSSRR